MRKTQSRIKLVGVNVCAPEPMACCLPACNRKIERATPRCSSNTHQRHQRRRLVGSGPAAVRTALDHSYATYVWPPNPVGTGRVYAY